MVNNVSDSSDKSKIIWEKGQSVCSLTDFLSKFLPSKTYQHQGGDGWIWVTNREVRFDTGSVLKSRSDSLHQAQEILTSLEKRLMDIGEDQTIPLLSTDKSKPSKRHLQEEAVRKCETSLREIGSKDWLRGKWLFFESKESVDLVFTRLARSIIGGPLSKLKKGRCDTIKVSMADNTFQDRATSFCKTQYVIALYFEDIWAKEHAAEVLECIIKEHGQIPNSAKPELFTMISLDSKHPSRVRATLYRPYEIFEWKEMQQWLSAYGEGKNKVEHCVNTQSSKRPSSSTNVIKDNGRRKLTHSKKAQEFSKKT